MKSAVKVAVVLLVTALVVTVLVSPAAALRVLRSSPEPTLDDAIAAGTDGAVEVHTRDTVASGGVSVAETPTMWVKPVASTVLLDDVFTVEIMKNSQEALGAFEFHVRWDASRIEFLGASKGADVTESATFTHTRRAPHVRRVIGFEIEGEAVPQGTAALAEIQFRAIAEGSSPLDVIDSAEADDIPVADPPLLADIDNNPLADPEVTDGEVTVAESFMVFLPLVLRSP